MKRFKHLIVFVVVLSSLFYIQGIYAFLTSSTTPVANAFTVKDKVNYTVIHKKMNLDGETYTTVIDDTFTDEVSIGSTITPEVKEYQGFISPNAQTITINSFNDVTITYLYDRIQYHLTINNAEYVDTETPTGDYYYGQEIRLEAAEETSDGAPFVKWSNEVTDRVYEFTMESDVEIGPIYSNSYTITYEPNNGSSSITNTILEDQPIGTFPTVVNESCTGTEGTYSERNCEYAYELVGWYAEPTFEHEIGESLVPNEDITLYAKWNKVYYHKDGPYVFDGTNFLDTQIKLFSEENAKRDFVATLTLDAAESGQENRAVLFGNMDENGEPYPGVLFRYFNNRYNINANVAVGNKKNTAINFAVGQTIIIKRENGILSYSTNNGQTFTDYNDYSNFNLYFDTTATFGGEYDKNHVPYRFFKGTFSNMTLELTAQKKYTVHFDANGGTGSMADQKIVVGQETPLRANAFTYQGNKFVGWNTEADGTGTSYSNKQVVSNLGNEDETITLYAQWETATHYFVAFDANGGTGTMENQEFIYDVPQALSSVEFSKEGYIFAGWDTEPDGTGTRYKDKEIVSNLSEIDQDVVTLYAQYEKSEYRNDGEITFDGVDDYIDTGINLYSNAAIDKDFTISFDVIEIDPENANMYQATIMNAKEETYPAELVPGFVTRFEGDVNNIRVKSRWGTSSTDNSIRARQLPIHFEFTRTNGVVKMTYSTDGGATTTEKVLYNQGVWDLDYNWSSTVTFGAVYKDGEYQRFFKGKLANLVIQIEDN